MKMILCNSVDGTNCGRGRGLDSSVYQMAHCFITGKCYSSAFYGFSALTLLHLDLRGPLGVRKKSAFIIYCRVIALLHYRGGEKKELSRLTVMTF